MNIAPGVSHLSMIKTGKPPRSFSRKLARKLLSQSCGQRTSHKVIHPLHSIFCRPVQRSDILGGKTHSTLWQPPASTHNLCSRLIMIHHNNTKCKRIFHILSSLYIIINHVELSVFFLCNLYTIWVFIFYRQGLFSQTLSIISNQNIFVNTYNKKIFICLL